MDNPRRKLLDGAMATNMFNLGMPKNICIEEFLLDNSDLIKGLQKQFVESGSDIIYAPTFSANSARLKRFDKQDNVYEYNKKLLALSKEVCEDRLVAGNISPTGLIGNLNDEYTLEEIFDIYKQQANALKQADLFAIETMFSLKEAKAAVLACREYDVPIFVTFTIKENGKTLLGEDILAILISLQDLGISAFGLNCCTIDVMLPWIKQLSEYSKVPLIAKPCAGSPNILLPNLYDLSPTMMAKKVEALLDCGVTYIGGCCGTTPKHIAEIKKVIDKYNSKENNIVPVKDSHDIVLANANELFMLDYDNIEFSDEINCEIDMTDSFLNAEESGSNIMLININSVEESLMFAENQYMAKLPVCFRSEDGNALMMAIKHYYGKAMVDSKSGIENIKEICLENGAYLY